MGNLVRLEEIKCPSCGATLTIPENSTNVIIKREYSVVKCEYCGSEFVVNMEQENNTVPPPRPDWVPMQPVQSNSSSSPIRAYAAICCA